MNLILNLLFNVQVNVQVKRVKFMVIKFIPQIHLFAELQFMQAYYLIWEVKYL